MLILLFILIIDSQKTISKLKMTKMRNKIQQFKWIIPSFSNLVQISSSLYSICL